MRTLPIMLTVGLGLGLAFALTGPARADAGLSVRIGTDGGASIGTEDPDEVAPGRAAPRDRHHKRDHAGEQGSDSRFTIRKRPPEWDRDRDRGRDRRKERPFFLLPRLDDDDDDRVILVPVPTPPPEPEPETAEPPPPPDPRGPAIKRARGAATAAPVTVGEPLPDDVPHVALDWRRYGLTEPPPGLVYARVGRTVLLLDPATRVVERVVEAETLAPREG